MPVHNEMAQRAARKRTGLPGTTRVTVELNPTVLAALDAWVANDTGIGRRLTREAAICWMIADCTGLNRPVPFTPLAIEKTS